MIHGRPKPDRPLRLCRIVTVPLTFKWLFWDQLRYLTQHGFDVTLVSSPGPELEEVAADLGVAYHAVTMARDPSPRQDWQSVVMFTRWLRGQQFDMLHSSTPKAGLVGALAGRICGVPMRVHTYTGQVWMEMQGPMRMAVKGIDRLIGQLSTHCLTDSASQRQFLIDEGVVPAHKLAVLGAGSVAGVDLTRFDPQRWQATGQSVRAEWGIAPETVVICYLGRLRADKGIDELVAAFVALQAQSLPVELILIGPPEYERRPLSADTQSTLQTNPHIHITGYTPTPEKYLAASDLFCFPSYREGFGTAVIEAAAMGLPVVASRVQGCVDSVEDGVTGRLVPMKDVVSLTTALQELVVNRQLLQRMGQAAQARAVQLYQAAIVNSLVADYLAKQYEKIQLS